MKNLFGMSAGAALLRRHSPAFLTALMLGLSTLLLAAPASAAVIFQERFQSGLGQFSGEGRVYTGSYGVRMRGGDPSGVIVSNAIDTRGHTNITLSFNRESSGLGTGEFGVVSYSVNGGAYSIVEARRTVSGRTTIELGDNAAGVAQLRIRFHITADSFFKTFEVSNVVVEGTATGGGVTPPPPQTILPPVTRVDANGPFATREDRNVGPSNGWVVRPTNLGQNGMRHPIFIWGPGAGTGPSNYSFHLNRIASHGFVVFSAVSTGDGSEMRAAINWLIAENGRVGSPYYNRLDTSRIAIGGHSRGSLSAFGAASDPRVRTSIHVAGGSFDGNGSRNLRNPAMYIAGANDRLANSNIQRDYTRTTVPVFFTTIARVGHNDAAREGLPATIAWLRWHIADEIQRSSMFLGPRCDFCSSPYSSVSKNW